MALWIAVSLSVLSIGGIIDVLESNVRVKDNSSGENRIHDRVQGAADEGSDGERNKTGRNETTRD